MKAFLLAAVVSTARLAPQAFAQGRNFEGFSVGANATSSSVGTDAKGLGVSDKFGDSSENFGLQAAYGFPMGSNGVLGLGGTYTLADFNAGNISSGSTAMKLKGQGHVLAVCRTWLPRESFDPDIRQSGLYQYEGGDIDRGKHRRQREFRRVGLRCWRPHELWKISILAI